MAGLGLRWCTRAFSSCREWGLLFVAGPEARLKRLSSSSSWSMQISVVVAHELSCSAACGIFLDQGSNPCPLHWQAFSYALHRLGSPHSSILAWEIPWTEELGRLQSMEPRRVRCDWVSMQVTVDLQHCVSFRRTPRWLHFIYTYIFFLFQIFFPSRLLQNIE